MRGIIVDGVASAGKSSILNHLHLTMQEQYPASTKLFISEHYTERMLEHLRDRNTLNGSQIQKHALQIIRSLRTYQNMLEKSKFKNNPGNADVFVTLERFLLTHFSSINIEDRYPIKNAKLHMNMLSELGLKQIILVVPENRIRDSILSTLQYRNNEWKKHLLSQGNENEIIKNYINWQNNFLDYVDVFRTSIDTEIIQIEHTNYSKISEEIMDRYFK